MFRQLLEGAMGTDAPDVSVEEVDEIDEFLDEEEGEENALDKDDDDDDDDDDEDDDDDDDDDYVEVEDDEEEKKVTRERSQSAIKEATAQEAKDCLEIDEIFTGGRKRPSKDDDGNKSRRNRRKKSERKRKKRRKRGKAVKKISQEASYLLGQANMQFACGEFEDAITLLKSFIQLEPTVPDSYHTLGVIHETQKKMKKALQFYMIAASLTPQDLELWTRVGQIAWDEQQLSNALYCYKRAFRLDSKDPNLISQCAELYLLLEMYPKAAMMFEKWIQLDPSQFSIWLRVAECHYQKKDYPAVEKALLSCLQVAFDETKSSDSENVGINAINMLADLYIFLKQYDKGIQIIQKYLMANKADTSSSSILKDLPIDIAVKLGICHVYLNDLATANKCFELLSDQNMAEYGDLYVDIGECYLDSKQEIPEALQLFQQLMEHEQWQNKHTWYKVSACYSSLKQYHKAYEYQLKAVADENINKMDNAACEQVVKAMGLCCRTLQFHKGLDLFDQYLAAQIKWMPSDEDDRVEAIENNDKTAPEAFDGITEATSMKAIVQWILIQGKIGNVAAVLQYGIPILLICEQQASKLLARLQHLELDSEQKEIAELRERYLPNIHNENEAQSKLGKLCQLALHLLLTKVISENNLLALLLEVADALLHKKEHISAISLLVTMLNLQKIQDARARFEVRIKTLLVALDGNNANVSYQCIVQCLYENKSDTGLWNLFNRVMYWIGIPMNHQKNMMKLLNANPQDLGVMQTAANYSLSTDLKLAIGEFSVLYHYSKDDPLIPLSIAVCFINLTMSRKTTNPKDCVANAMAFLQDYQRRRQNQNNILPDELVQAETNYNIGRAYQQLGLYYLAIPIYERALFYFDTAKDHIHPGHNLAQEIAYNLSIIYQSSGSADLARHLIQKYIRL